MTTRCIWGSSIVLGLVVWVVVAFDYAFWGKLFSYLLAMAAHGCLAVLIVAAFYFVRAYFDPASPGTGFLISGGSFGVGALVLTFALFKVGRVVLSLPVDSGWTALYVIVASSAFWLALVASILVFSPAIDLGQSGVIAAKVAMSVVTVVATVLLLAVVTAQFARDRQNDIDKDAIHIPQITTVSEGVYVALGDSYSAGEGLSPFLDGRPDADIAQPEKRPACHRSNLAYPMLLRFTKPLKPEFRACSGAITSDIDQAATSAHDHPPQLDKQPRDDVSLVTITVGGNDAAFSKVVQACFFFDDCIDADFEPPDQHDGRRRIIFPGREPLEDWASDALLLLSRNVERVFDDIRHTYPRARKIVIGYPYLFPSGGAPTTQNDCAIVLRRVSETERDALRKLTDDLNLMLLRQASEADLEFISPADTWDGHEPCGQEGQYTNALKPFGTDWSPLDGGSFHPNRKGQRALARLVACYLNANPRPAPPSPDALPQPPPCEE